MEEINNYFKNKFQIKINNWHIFEQALTHNSYANEHKLKYTYQRLEFFGDALIEKYVSAYLYKQYANENEGSLTKKRSEIVREETLSQVTKRIELNKLIRLGNGEEASGGRNKDSILADVFESVTAAIFLDNEQNNPDLMVKKWLDQTLINYIQDEDYKDLVRDYKSELQELLQSENRKDLEYKVLHELRKDDNKMEYEVAVVLEGQVYGHGTGTSKQDAEQAAAKESLGKLKK